MSADGDAAHSSGLGARPLDPPPGPGRFARVADLTAQGWASGAAPPPGTYAPAVAAEPAEARADTQRMDGVDLAPELSPAARRCLTDVFALLDRATLLLSQAAEIVARDAQGPAAEHVPASAAGARTAAVDLAVRGLPRGQVGERLVAEHGVSDPGPLLDDVFGSGTPASGRLLDQVTRRP